MRASMFAANRTVRLVAACWLMLALLAPAALAEGASTHPDAAALPGAPSVPLSFSPLPDASRDGPRYEAQGAGGRFTFDGTGYTLSPGAKPSPSRAGAPLDRQAAGSVRMQFEGAMQAALTPSKLLPGAINDLSAADPRSWRTSAPTYGVLTYRQLYNGIDLQFEGLPGRFKSTFYVLPGADPNDIRWRYTGATSVNVSRESGELWVELPGSGTNRSYLIEGAPLAWQETGGHKTIVPARYEVDAAGVIGYGFGAYDPSRVLVIDPVIMTRGAAPLER